MPLKPGQTLIERYRIDQPLGQGGSGTVYKAWDLHLDRPRALKENLGLSPEAQRQFRREAQMLADLRHPNLPRVIDHFLIPGQGQYLVMEFVEGEDLQSLVQRTGRLPQDRALAWIRQVCDAVAYLHHLDPPVIHRDIKPANIRLTPAGMAMLVDFGIAKTYDPATPTTLGARALTSGFAPPEQYGQGKTDQQSDIYALGATLYTLLTGRAPDDSIDSLLRRVPPLPPAHQVNPKVAPGVSAAIAYAMQLEKSQRYATVEAFQTALTVGAMGGPVEPPRLDRRGRPTEPTPGNAEIFPSVQPVSLPTTGGLGWTEPAGASAALPGQVPRTAPATSPGGVPAGPYPPVARSRASGWSSRLWLVLAGGGGLALLLCLLGGALLWRMRPAALPVGQTQPALPGLSPSPTSPAVTVPATSPPAPLPGDTPTYTPAVTPTLGPASWQQGRLAWLEKQSGGHALYIQSGDDQPSLVYTGAADAANRLSAPVWAPDGSRIALYSLSGQLLVVDASPGATPRTLANCIFPSWSGDGSQIGCSTGNGRTYQLVSADTGQVVGRFPLANNSVLPVLSPTRSEIAYVERASGSTRLWRMGLDGTDPVLLAGEASENYAPAWSPDGQQIAYQSNEGGGLSEIWVVGRDGGRRQITQTPNNAWSRAPAWSPDGQWLAFVSNQEGSLGADYGEVFVVSLATGEVFQATESGGSIYDWRVGWGR